MVADKEGGEVGVADGGGEGAKADEAADGAAVDDVVVQIARFGVHEFGQRLVPAEGGDG